MIAVIKPSTHSTSCKHKN